MRPKRTNHDQGLLFEQRLSRQLNPGHSLYKLARDIPWEGLEQEFGPLFSDVMGAPAKPTRLIVGTLLLQSMFKVSDQVAESKTVEFKRDLSSLAPVLRP